MQLFLPIFIFIYNVNNHKKQRATSKITKEPKQKSRLGTASNKNYWGASTSLRSTNLRPCFCLSSPDTTTTYKKNKTNKTNEKQSGQLVLKDRWPQCYNYIQVYTVDATAIKRARKNEKEQLRGDKAEVPPWDG